MSTRGLFGFRDNGKDIAIYNHFDSYPRGLGKDVITFYKNLGFEKVRDGIQKIEEINPNIPPTKEQIEYCKEKGWFDNSVSTRTETDWYCLLRHMQSLSAWEEAFANGEKVLVENSINFITDSLFCEYAYILNFEKEVLEYYKGFQKSFSQTRFENECHNGYYACKLMLEIPFKEVINESTITLVKKMEKIGE